MSRKISISIKVDQAEWEAIKTYCDLNFIKPATLCRQVLLKQVSKNAQ